MTTLPKVVIGCVLFFSIGLLSAQEQDDSPEADDEIVESSWIDKTIEWLDEQHDYISEQIAVTGTRFDQYIARDSFDADIPNRSYLRIRLRQGFDIANNSDFNASVKTYVDIPNTKGRVRLFFDSDPDDFLSLEDRRQNDEIANELQRRDQSALGISFVGKERGRWSPSIDLGTRAKIPLDLYIKGRLRRYDHVFGEWHSRFRQSLYYYKERGWGSDSEYDLYRPIGEDKLLRSSSELQYLGKKRTWGFFQGFYLYHSLDNKNMIEYVASVSVIDKTAWQIGSYLARVKWRHLAYKDWLFVSIAPEIQFPRKENFKLTPGIFFEVEVFFAKNMRNRWI